MAADDRLADLTAGDDLARKRLYGRVFVAVCLISTLVGVVALGLLVADLIYEARGWLTIDFLTHPPSWFPENYQPGGRGAGLYPAIIGSVFLIALTALFTIFLGVGAAIYLEEYAPDNRLTRFIEANIANLAGVPSIVYGLLGLAIFVRAAGLGSSLLAGALTLTLLILPIVIVSAQEAIRAVPDSRRQAAYGVGATKWQVTRDVVLPSALPGIMTGTILSLSRAIGETAPILMVGAATFMIAPPDSLLGPFSAMPMQVFEWAKQPDPAFQHIAAAGSIVLLTVLVLMNATAILIRNKYDTQ
ncbi:ABC-type transport system permease protein (probable substrate phosphate) [Natronomonas pharaonis DSM 2160]|uniref:Phosphate transport system permease protein PstA n=1 Tax=Natronomonas pharaonis (strain ATCC 35678 / DSM 2160 / CIP 103997 / JCM 8858 / NBRC 14720 / NCIMB 2260 / Gabara) TaxID=348780 RepID=A0A1U7EVL5_NATPD|nr:phosphate ABC transporter permease PstA [Natronomonas pharaonis]CAI49082.1 ABC-type transport system permease protein (probable substrate phosphate) [Natronomonas pharaonis DSM 2160]